MKVEIPYAFREVLEPYRYKVFYGGRGAARSWTFARVLVSRAYERPLRVGCFREYQTNIKESVHQVLADQIRILGLESAFSIGEKTITSSCGSEFFFRGLSQDPDGVKSIEGMDVAWVEEAHSISRHSLNILRPTVRKAGSELWFSMNTGDEDDPIYEDLIAKPPASAVVRLVTFEDNPWLPAGLEEERLLAKERDEDVYNNVWLGLPRRISDAIIFRRRVVVHDFETPGEHYGEEHLRPRFYFGADFGFAVDPATLIRFWTTGQPPDEELWIDYEAYGHRTEMDLLPGLYDHIPYSRIWPIRADSARPETISYLARQGFNITAAEKWSGSVEDGVTHLKAYKKIHVHTRCPRIAREFVLYSYKIDRKTGDVLPVIIDKHNHGIDAVRYGHDGLIQRRGGIGQWIKLGAA